MTPTELVDRVTKLAVSKPLPLVPTGGLWTSRSPVLLTPSLIPGQRNFHNPTQSSVSIFPRYHFGLGANESGDVYIYGGRTSTHGRRDELYHYSVKDNTATLLQCSGTSPGSRGGHGMALVGNVIAVHGGWTVHGDDPDLYLLNLVSRQWTKMAASGDAPWNLIQHAMAAIGTTIYIFGGHGSNGVDTNELWAFDLNTCGSEHLVNRKYDRSNKLHRRGDPVHTPEPRWERIEPRWQVQPTPRYAATLVSYHDRLILFGGYGAGRPLGDVWYFDSKTTAWTELLCTGNIPPSRLGHTAAILEDVMYIIGGSKFHSALEGDLGGIFALKIPAQRWYKLKHMSIRQRYHHASVCMGTKIFTFGGDLGGAFEAHGIHILDANYVDNPNLHTSERLKELGIKFGVMPIREKGGRGQDLEPMKMAKRNKIISCILKYPSKMESLAQLQGTDAQIIVDFLADELGHQDILQSNSDKRHILHLLTKLAKSTQIFPKSTELSDVQCNLTNPVNDEGGYGFIYKGVFRKQAVCVKAVRMIGYGARLNKMLRAQAGEAVLLAHVSHPNVIPLYGAYLSREEVPRICIVSPWMENGDLAAYLGKFPGTPKIPLMCDAIAGLDFLHDMGIIHADLKARNVLISQSQQAMLADFGVATIMHTNVGTTTAGDFAGTDYWMAPELLIADDHITPTKQSDMWGFACICYEMLTGEIPFRSHYHRPTQLIMAFMKGRRITPLRPKQGADPVNVDGELWVPLAERCWNYDPNERPTAAEALQFLTSLNVQDDRLLIDGELATFKAVRNSRLKVEVDYDHALSIIRNA